MDKRVKHRIIGVIVLVILVALLIPLFFTGSKKSTGKVYLSATIPNRPLPQVLRRAVDLQELQAQKQNGAVTLSTQPTIQQQESIDKGAYWVIQLASFADHVNANELMKKLIYKGYVAHIETEKTDKGHEYYVLVGPKMSREKAESLLERLQNTFHLKGLITRYKI
ncbi:MAG: hypothetical protein AMJ43_01895 [Coxiella sp. DG_40]|nr:MAG: hypothetical protein AMJ43_01895 [Coxiella sp. DG_40]